MGAALCAIGRGERTLTLTISNLMLPNNNLIRCELQMQKLKPGLDMTTFAMLIKGHSLSSMKILTFRNFQISTSLGIVEI